MPRQKLKHQFDALETEEEKIDFLFTKKKYFCVDISRKDIFVLKSEAKKYHKGKLTQFTPFEIKMDERELLVMVLTAFGVTAFNDLTF